MSRAKHLGRGKGDYGTGKMGDDVICVQIHGDAALAGQVLYLLAPDAISVADPGCLSCILISSHPRSWI